MILEELTPYERETLDDQHDRLMKAANELLACPRWRIVKRAALSKQWTLEAKIMDYLTDEFKIVARDRRLFGRDVAHF